MVQDDNLDVENPVITKGKKEGKTSSFVEKIEDEESIIFDNRYRPLKPEDKSKDSTQQDLKTITRFEISKGFSGRWAKVPLILAGFFLFISITALTALLILPESSYLNNLEYFSAFFLTPTAGPGSLISIQVAVVCSGLIASDLKDKTLPIYMTKVNMKDYFISKFSASLVLSYIGLPFFSLVYFVIVIYKRGFPNIFVDIPTWIYDWFMGVLGLQTYRAIPYGVLLLGDYLLILSKIIAFSILLILVYSSIILFLSSSTERAINAGVLFIVFIIASNIIFEEILYETTNIEFFQYFSPVTSLRNVYRKIFVVNLATGTSFGGFGAPSSTVSKPSNSVYLSSLLALILMIIGSLYGTYWNLKRYARRGFT